MRRRIESLIKGVLLGVVVTLLSVTNGSAQNFQIRKYSQENNLTARSATKTARDVSLTLNEGYQSEEFSHNCAGGFDFLSNGDVVAIEYDFMNPPEIFIFDANGDGIPAAPQHIGYLAPDYYGSFIKVSPEGDYALFGSTAGSGDPHYIEKIDLSTYEITQIVQLQGNFSLVFMDNEQVLISANADWDPATPNCIHYLDVEHPEQIRVIASIDETPSGPLELNATGDLYYVKSTHAYPTPPNSHHLFKFTAVQVNNTINQGAVLSEDDSQIDIILDSGYNIALNAFNDLFVADLAGNIYKVNEKDGTKSIFCQTAEGGFSHMAFYKPTKFFNPYQQSLSKLAVAFSDIYYMSHVLIGLSPQPDDSFADEVLDFSPGFGGGGDMEKVLGTPVGGGTYAADNSSIILLGDRDNPDENSPATVDLRFHYPILDDAQNLCGLDLIIFSNSFWAADDPHNRFTEPALIEVSKDLNHNGIADDEWFLLLSNILADDLGPLDPVEYYSMTLRNYGEYSPTLKLGDIDGDNVVDVPDMDPEEFYTVPDELCYEGDEQSYLVDAYSGGGDASDLREAVVQDPDLPPGNPLVDEFGYMHYVHLDRVDFVRLRDARNADMHIPPYGMVTAEIDAVSDARKDLRGSTISVSTVTELEAALGTANEGDEIVLTPGIYQIADTLVIPLGVSLKGSAGLWTVNYANDDTVIDGENLLSQTAAVSLIDTSGSYFYEQGYTISGIHFKNCSLAIYVEDLYPMIENNVFENVSKALTLMDCQRDEVMVRNNIFGHRVLSLPEIGIEANNTNLALMHNDFVNFSQEGVLLRNACKVYLRDNIFADNETGLFEEDAGYVYGHYNVFYGNTADYSFVNGAIENDVLANPSFAIAALGDYRLAVDSPVRSLGMGGADPGVYDGPNFYPFDIAIGYYLDLNQFPWYESDEPTEQFSGPAVAKMWLSYLWWDNIANPEGPLEYPQTQQWLYDYGQPENYACNQDLTRLDARGLWYTVQNLDPAYNPYHYNFGIYKRDTVDEALDAICHWIVYPAGGGSANPNGYGVDGYPVHVPAAVTAYGNYDNWMVIRGIRTTENPWESSEYDIFGFWVNDPNPSGIGENSYKTAQQWQDDYYYSLAVDPTDPCNGKWVAIVEPPASAASVTVVRPRSRFITEATALFTEQIVQVDGIDRAILLKKPDDELALDVVKAAVEGVCEELIPYDLRFTQVFNRSSAGMPSLVKGKEGKDYYLVPFNTIAKTKVKNNALPYAASEADTLAVVLVDARNGSFKEASWVDTPVKYLPIPLQDALEIVSERVKRKKNSSSVPLLMSSLDDEAMVELVHLDASPYYPAWKVQIGSRVYIVNQQGEVSIKDKLLKQF